MDKKKKEQEKAIHKHGNGNRRMTKKVERGFLLGGGLGDGVMDRRLLPILVFRNTIWFLNKERKQPQNMRTVSWGTLTYLSR